MTASQVRSKLILLEKSPALLPLPPLCSSLDQRMLCARLSSMRNMTAPWLLRFSCSFSVFLAFLFLFKTGEPVGCRRGRLDAVTST